LRRSPGFDLGIDFAEILPDFANELITRVEGRMEIMMGAGQTCQMKKKINPSILSLIGLSVYINSQL
jgi:hypothetical protein